MKRLIFAFALLFSMQFLIAQEKKRFSSVDFNGYLSGMPSLYWLEDSSAWQVLIHNRLNFNWYPSDKVSGSLQFRNQLIGGEFVEATGYENGFRTEAYYLPLSYYQTMGDMYLLYLSIDRAWLKYTHNSLEVKLGRQRINWGQTFVWNPNDLFNSYNFFEFDYPERPGADALRVQYYTSYTSSVELAAKVDSAGKITAGALLKFNKWNTDFQLIAGYFSQENSISVSPLFPPLEWEDEDLVGGLGFSGALGSISVRGEMSYFYSLKENNDSTNQFLGALTIDYTFSNQLAMMAEFFYNSNVQLPGTSFLNFYGGSQNVKTLTFTKYNAFGQVSYPIIPILNATLSGMYFWDENLAGMYVGPTFDLSLGDNLTLGAYFQFFAYKVDVALLGKTEWEKVNFAFLRLKWNF